VAWLIHDPSSRFIAQLVVVVGLARLLARAARKIGQPPVVAEIIGGIVLGPSVFGALAPSVSNAVFPPGALEPLASVSQLGVLLFVFLVGLEVEPAMLRGRARAAFSIAIAGIVVPFVLGAAVAVPVYELVTARMPSLEIAMFVGAAMAVTAFPVLARLLGDHRLLRTRIGALAIACAAIGDVIAWCLLAFVIAFARSDGLLHAATTTALALVFVATMLLGVRPLLERLVDRSNSPLTLTHEIVAVGVLGALGSAWISHRIGVHFVFGAFIFGALIPKRDGFAHALADKLEAIVVVVFLPLFFVVSGLRTHVGLVASANHALACVLIVGVACLGKLGGTAIAARANGLRWGEAGALGILMNTRGLMELIVLNVGFELGVLDPAIFTMMIVMVLVTTIAASPVLSRVYPARDAIRDLVAELPGLPPARVSEDRILACISHSSGGPEMVALAGALGGQQAEIIALHLTREDELVDAERAAEADVLGPALARAAELSLPSRALSFSSRAPADDIVRVADVRVPDVVLLGLHKPVLGNDVFGGVVRGVLRDADTQVAVFVDRGLSPRPARLLVPFQRSDHGRAALRLAARIQRSFDAALVVLAGADACAEALAILDRDEVRASVETIAGSDEVVDRAADCDLIIVGVDDNPEHLIRECSPSLLVVRGRTNELARAKVNR
jgi:Kef-type K+ transport system membrane component KefB